MIVIVVSSVVFEEAFRSSKLHERIVLHNRQLDIRSFDIL
jgi:hypothetical protein